MANRILLDEDGLKISKPGVNVLTAGLAGLQFTSVGTHVPRFTTGTLTRSQGGDATFNFGKTFPAAPIVTWYASNLNIGGVGPASFVDEPTFGTVVQQWQIFIYTNRLVLSVGMQSSVTLNFKVWDFG